MASITITGNLTKDADLKTGRNNKPYVLLRIAENMTKVMDKEGIKEEANKTFQEETYYFSVFVNNPDMIEVVKDLEKGQALQITGRANISLTKNEQGYDQQVLSSIKASRINLDPFSGRNLEQTHGLDEPTQDIA